MPPQVASIRELHVGQTQLAHAAMRELRTAYDDAPAFIGAFSPDREAAVAVAGFRTGASLAWGRYLYVDDLTTALEARRQGHAGALLDWLISEARKLGCTQLHLDSGTARERFDAHRLYYNHGLAIHSYHFARGV